jgi:hypothetical protein|tara:strand:- start:833 stop:1330 length:498 start_codon:yes stop_codon:yes gene_type:complete
MNYDQRILHIKQWFKSSVLTRFTPPNGVDPLIVAVDTIEAINANIPADADINLMNHYLDSIIKETTRQAKSRTLPVIEKFTLAARGVSVRGSGVVLIDGPATRVDREYIITEGRVKRGEAISDIYLSGHARQTLLMTTSVTKEDLDKYLAPAARMQYNRERENNE